MELIPKMCYWVTLEGYSCKQSPPFVCFNSKEEK